MRLATDAAEIGTWDLDLNTDTLSWTDRTKAMFGISPEVECDMRDFYNGLHPEDREATGQAFAAALDPATRTVYDVEYRTIGKEDKRTRWVAAKIVIGSLDLMRRRMGTQEPNLHRYLDAATEGARRAALLTQRLLAFSRQQPLKPQTTDINNVVSGMSDLLRHSLGTDIRLETVLAGGLWRTHVDPNQLENVILTLS